MTDELSALLAQYNKHNARGSLLAANQTMTTIIETLVAMIKQQGCQCACQSKPPPVSNARVLNETPTAQAESQPVITPAPADPIVDDLSIPPVPVKRPVGRPRKHPRPDEPPTEPHAG